MCSIALLQSMVFMLQILLKLFLTILDSCLTSMLRNPNPYISSFAGSSNVSDKNPVDSGLDEHNVNSANFGGYFDKSDNYKWYLNESSTRSEKSQLDIYLEEPELELNKIGCKNDEDDEDDVSSIAF
ncbi:hypothetical protein Gotur_017235 [Gossypium turneri]